MDLRVSARRAKSAGSAEIRHDTQVTPEADVTNEDKADPTPDEASAIPADSEGGDAQSAG